MVLFGVYLLFVTSAAGLIFIKPPVVASAFIILQFVTGAALTTPEEKPPEKTEIVEDGI